MTPVKQTQSLPDGELTRMLACFSEAGGALAANSWMSARRVDVMLRKYNILWLRIMWRNDVLCHMVIRDMVERYEVTAPRRIEVTSTPRMSGYARRQSNHEAAPHCSFSPHTN